MRLEVEAPGRLRVVVEPGDLVTWVDAHGRHLAPPRHAPDGGGTLTWRGVDSSRSAHWAVVARDGSPLYIDADDAGHVDEGVTLELHLDP